MTMKKIKMVVSFAVTFHGKNYSNFLLFIAGFNTHWVLLFRIDDILDSYFKLNFNPKEGGEFTLLRWHFDSNY